MSETKDKNVMTPEQEKRALFIDFENQIFAFRKDSGDVEYRVKGWTVEREDWLAIITARRTFWIEEIGGAFSPHIEGGVLDKLTEIKDCLTRYTTNQSTGETIETGIADVIAERD